MPSICKEESAGDSWQCHTKLQRLYCCAHASNVALSEWLKKSHHTNVYSYRHINIFHVPVVPHKAVAEVSRIGNV